MVARRSLDKIVGVYVASVAKHRFMWGERLFEPKELRVSPGVFRGFTCPAGCGGCCPRFSLEYLPGEVNGGNLKPRTERVNGKAVLMFADDQTDHRNRYCRHLNPENGRCGIHGRQPFSCDFELMRFIQHEDHNMLTSKLFGRGWAMLRIDGERGALCEMTPPNPETTEGNIRRLLRLQEWCTHLGIHKTHIPDVIEWMRNGPHDDALILKP